MPEKKKAWNAGVRTGPRSDKNKDGSPRKKPGPREPNYGALSEAPTDATERQIKRQALAEDLLDATLERLVQKIRGTKCRSQDLLVAVGFLSRNKFKITPSQAGVPDALDLINLKRQAQRIRELEAML